jgi:UDP-N-acetyl-alpha-D-muramoyl-L-alanyl-L-glutamate epimerase
VVVSLEELRRRHPRLVYRSFEVEPRGDDLRLGARFLLEPDIEFEPEVVINGVGADRIRACPPEVLDNLAFHVGLMEIPSYWKAACPPDISVEAGPLDEAQRAWWKDLLSKGMGEFVFVNGLDWDVVDQVRIDAAEGPQAMPFTGPASPDDVLVPIGGGKDSSVTAELVRRHSRRMGALLLNPTRAALDVASVARADQVITATRRIDPALLRLNEAGYLNGHTPFTGYLSFLGVACAALFGYGRIAMANERSSNEGNAIHRGRTVNHQYSKSWDFERGFRDYASAHLAPDVEPFSLLRPVWELQVARAFSGMSAYHPVFRSCNRGMSTNSWCGRCPKCLFVFVLLSPFLDREELVAMFGRDLFADLELLPTAIELVGAGGHKPFECVGTYDESRAAFSLALHRSGATPPRLLAALAQAVPDLPSADADGLLSAWNDEHAVPADLVTALRSELGMPAPEGAALGSRPAS